MSATDSTDGSSGAGAATLPERAVDLPEAVRARLVASVAAALPDVVRLPPTLRSVASFVPARRARAGAAAILAALDDPGDRDRIGRAARTSYDLAAMAEEGVPVEADPAEVAALAWLCRPERASEVYAAALARHNERAASSGDPAELDRLRRRVGQLEQDLRDQRSAKKDRLDELKEENRRLRRKLGETRGTLTEAQRRVEEAERETAELRSRSEGAARSEEKEIRRLRAEVERLEAVTGAERRSEREEREEASVRSRVLLETLIDAAAGLRRELAIPAVTRTPGERAEERSTTYPATGDTPALRVTSGSILEQFLGMPRARLIVDGYNVSKSVWPTSPLEAQRIRLLQALAPVAARSNAETTVVFDAAQVTHRPIVAAPRGVRVVFSPTGVIADDVIRDLVAAEPAGRVVLVVSDDQEVANDVTRAGARAVTTAALLRLTEQR